MAKNCVICGKSSGMYPLCREHLQMKAEGKVVKCEDCGTWHLVGTPCACSPAPTVAEDKVVDTTPALKCIICGQDSNGYHFCRSCYAKYKDRAVDLRIVNCSETEILDEYGNKKYTCVDGRKVRSLSEKIINDFFFNERIRVVYEKTLYYTENGEQKTLHPDFFLPDYDLFIEFNGLTNKDYLRKKEYAKRIYEQMNKKVLILVQEDLEDLEACLKPKLGLN